MSERKKDLVILLHGIALNRSTFWMMERRLKQAGYDTKSITYPSTKFVLQDLAHWLVEQHLPPAIWAEYDHIHLIGHSMGGLLIREFLHHYKDQIPREKLGRVVMIGTPNRGSEYADLLLPYRLFHRFFGPAGAQLTTNFQEQQHPDIYYDLGVIAAAAGPVGRWHDPIAHFVFKEAHDGKVSVERTKIEGMKDHITVTSTHTFMLWQRKVAGQVIYFLRNGVFDHHV